jgi:hypothetical protein
MKSKRCQPCNPLDLETLLGSWPIMPKNLPNWFTGWRIEGGGNLLNGEGRRERDFIKDHFTHETESPWPSTLQALSLVEKVEPVHIRYFTLRLRDQRSMWMQDGDKSLHGFLHSIEWIMFHCYLDCFQKPPLGGRPSTKLGDHGTPIAHNHWFILIYHVWVGACVNTNSLK